MLLETTKNKKRNDQPDELQGECKLFKNKKSFKNRERERQRQRDGVAVAYIYIKNEILRKGQKDKNAL